MSTAYSSERALPALLLEMQEEGFTHDILIHEGGRLVCRACGIDVPAEAADVVRIERFEGVTNPEDESMLVAVRLHGADRVCCGTLVLGYGPQASAESAEVLRRLETHRPR